MGIKQNKAGSSDMIGSASGGRTPTSQSTIASEDNRKIVRKAVFGDTANTPALQETFKVIDGDKNYSSSNLKEQDNVGS